MNAKVDYDAKIRKSVEIALNVEMNTNDIFNWLSQCNNADTLRYLGGYAFKQARNIENPDDDDFRSRA